MFDSGSKKSYNERRKRAVFAARRKEDAADDKWDDRFMEMAHVIAGWTSCFRPGRSIGCVIVKDKAHYDHGLQWCARWLKDLPRA